ncbi:MAG: dTDP-4-dehydrorhamnose reductase [Kiritimatiellae bacterium]|nr:dTDP-4-dehydrorhamnose reductase [Kiritimatiellia bacterium]
MKIVITGGKGMLGRTLQKEFAGNEITVADLPEWDITDADAFMERLEAEKPDAVIHAAAMTKVDDCESKREAAFRLNEEGSRNVAMAAKACGARLVAISTDYVFSGDAPKEPWAWAETDIPAPKTVYGQSKLAGENMISMIMPEAAVLRIAWLYGAGGPSFVHTMVKLGAEDGPALKVVDDQRGNPTSCKAVAGAIRFLLGRPDISGVVHGTCEGIATWYEFACEIKKLVPSFKRGIIPCSTAEFPRPAPRPANSALRKSVLNRNGMRTPPWKDALAQFVREEFRF